ncbi:MAG TPA: hypothetical protein VN207_02160, partial [Ktedonobacteraceae bacterium]|nr:hypothetical protein [Ktedonobacteraceae bacterium]
FLQGPSIEQFTKQVLEQITAIAPAGSATSGAANRQEIHPQNLEDATTISNIDQQSAEQLLSQIDQLSEQEVDSLLSQMLAGSHGMPNHSPQK